VEGASAENCKRARRKPVPLFIMVSAFLIDAINNPTKVVQELYEEHTGNIDQFPAVVARHFSDVFLNSDDTLLEVGIYGILHWHHRR
jgi:hypothetical protein